MVEQRWSDEDGNRKSYRTLTWVGVPPDEDLQGLEDSC